MRGPFHLRSIDVWRVLPSYVGLLVLAPELYCFVVLLVPEFTCLDLYEQIVSLFRTVRDIPVLGEEKFDVYHLVGHIEDFPLELLVHACALKSINRYESRKVLNGNELVDFLILFDSLEVPGIVTEVAIQTQLLPVELR